MKLRMIFALAILCAANLADAQTICRSCNQPKARTRTTSSRPTAVPVGNYTDLYPGPFKLVVTYTTRGNERSLKSIFEDLKSRGNFEYRLTDDVPAEVMYSRLVIDNVQLPLGQLLQRVVRSTGLPFDVSFNNDTATVFRTNGISTRRPAQKDQGQTVVAESEPPMQEPTEAPEAPTTTVTPTLSRPAPSSAPVYSYPTAPAYAAPQAYPLPPVVVGPPPFPTYAGIGGNMLRNNYEMRAYLAAAHGAYSRNYPYAASIGVRTASLGGYYGGGYGGYGYGYYADCGMVPNHRNCTHGDLRIDGPRGEKFLRDIDIYVNGDNIGPASKFNRWPNDGAPLPIGEHQVVQFVRIADDMIVYETTTNIRSRYVMKGQPNIIRVDQNRMVNGPFRKRIQNPPNEQLPAQPASEVLREPGS